MRTTVALLSSALLVSSGWACSTSEDGGSPANGSTSAYGGGGGEATSSGGGSSSGGASTSGGGGDSTGGAGGAAGLGDPTVFRAADELDVCISKPPEASCTPADMAYVASEYGSTVTRHDASSASEPAFRLVAFVEREGPSSIDVLVVDDKAIPMAGVPVAFYFSSAPDSSRPDEWYPVKVSSSTNASGIAGFAIAASAYLPCCGCGGPHAIWVSQPGATADTTVASDLVDKLGMLGGTNHRHLDLIFQRMLPTGNAVDAVKCPLQ